MEATGTLMTASIFCHVLAHVHRLQQANKTLPIASNSAKLNQALGTQLYEAQAISGWISSGEGVQSCTIPAPAGV
jgi:hypothetical protein